ncbi:MAG TPA: metallophosphoesterase, partial [Haliangium sp.]|nr:metallophosphoesterase [Haliangium sp.]
MLAAVVAWAACKGEPAPAQSGPAQSGPAQSGPAQSGQAQPGQAQPDRAAPAPQLGAAPGHAPPCEQIAPLPSRFPAAPRIVAIGDLHGDLAAARRALTLAGAIDASERWIGKDLVVVQTGDVLDRGDDEQAILDLFERLERDAASAGGSFTWLLGNHELMNAAGDFRYATAAGLRDFA